MFSSRALAFLLATLCLLAGPIAQAQVGIEPIPDQTVPSGKTLVIPIPASDPGGPARSYTVTVGAPTISNGNTPATNAGFTATIRTGDPHLILTVTYSDSNTVTVSSTTPVITTGTMELQLLREFAPNTSRIIAGLAQGGFYSPVTTSGTTKYITFHRVIPEAIQGGDPNGNGTGGPGFTFPDEFHRALIFSGTAGQLAMANDGGNGVFAGSSVVTTTTNGNVVTTSTNVTPLSASNGTNGSQFFITLIPNRQYDFQYTLFGQLLRGFDTLAGIGATPLEFNTSGEYSEPVYPVDITSATVTQNNTDAVLLLSATGVCDAPVKVTATVVNGSAVTTATTGFIAHAVADDTNDPGFIQPTPPDIAAPNGTAKVAISGTDLQLDLLSYGYFHAIPTLDEGLAASGTSPILSIPLVSNTSNAIDAVLNHTEEDNTARCYRLFHIAAGTKPLTGAMASIPAGSGSNLNLGATPPLAVFSDPNAGDTPATFTATVNWGDGTPVLTSTGGTVTIAKDGAGRFELLAPHHYTTPGQFQILAQIASLSGPRLALTGTAYVGASEIAMSGLDLASKGGTVKNVAVATFKDNGDVSTPADYTATINWGDGAVTSGTIRSLGHSSFQVLGTHVYQTADAFTLCTTVSRGGSSTYAATTWNTATVSAVTAPQLFPPFPQIHLAQVWSPLYTDSNSILTTGSSGGTPEAGLVQGSDGNFYGTTTYGGTNSYGTVYTVNTSGSFNTLYNFTGGADGGNPNGTLVEDGTSGLFYGTTSIGGASGYGTIFSITTSGSFNTLYTFSGGTTDGGYPQAGLATDGTSVFYGTTTTGGNIGSGEVFSITPAGAFNTIYSFSGGNDGGDPVGGVIIASGTLYGTTLTGGSNSVGTVYQLTTGGALTTLHTFTTVSGTDGESPYAGVVPASDGTFYGTTLGGGGYGAGTVYQVTSSGSYNQIYAFTSGTNGQAPYGGVIAVTDGTLYGTTRFGGAYAAGSAFTITSGTFAPLYEFTGGNDGGNPYAPLVAGTDGYLYGTTTIDGTGGFGTVYQLSTGGAENTLYSFGAGKGFQISLRGSVQIVNSGNKPLLSGSGTFSVFADNYGNDTPFTSNGRSVGTLPALNPGQSTIFDFFLRGSTDTRLKLPLNFNPQGQLIMGQVTYSDPVGDFDGSSKVLTTGSFQGQ